MIREKRTPKPVEQYIIPAICLPRVRPKQIKKKKPEKAQYQVIPQTLKFLYPYTIYQLYGGLCLKEKDGTLFMSSNSHINTIMYCKGVEILPERNHKMLSIAFEIKIKEDTPAWQPMVEKLRRTDNKEYKEWAGIIEKYSLNYEDMLRARSNKEINVKGYSEDHLLHLVEEGRRFQEKMFENHPCLVFNTKVKENHLTLDSIELNDKYVEQLGYSLDSFVTATVNEGALQLFPNDSTGYNSNTNEKNYLSVFFDGDQAIRKMPTNQVDMPVKGGYIKKMQFNYYLIPIYEDKTFALKAMVSLSEIKPSKLKFGQTNLCKLNKRFLEEMLEREDQAKYFLQSFYHIDPKLPYTEQMKTCQIRELSPRSRNEYCC